MILVFLYHSISIHDHALLLRKTFSVSYLQVQIPSHQFKNKYLWSTYYRLRTMLSTVPTMVPRDSQSLKSKFPSLFQRPLPLEGLPWFHFLFYMLTVLSTHTILSVHTIFYFVWKYIHRKSTFFSSLVHHKKLKHTFILNPNSTSPNILLIGGTPPPKIMNWIKHTRENKGINLKISTNYTS